MGRPAFTAAELDRAIAAAQRRGLTVEIHRGTIRLVPGPAASLPSEDGEGGNSCDKAFGLG